MLYRHYIFLMSLLFAEIGEILDLNRGKTNHVLIGTEIKL